MEIVYRKLKELKPNPKNPRKSAGEEAVADLAQSIKGNPKYFEARPILLSNRTGDLVIIAGERRSEAAALLKMKTVPTILIPGLSEAEEDEIMIKDNTHTGKWDESKLKQWDKSLLQSWNVEGVDWGHKEREDTGERGILERVYVTPPFTILNSRGGAWLERKKSWKEIINDGGESREMTLSKSVNLLSDINNGVSILDPVLAEVVIKWFGIEGGTAFDCFAGDTVFGYVAAKLGMNFTGIELRPEQCALNNERTKGMAAKYICDDGQNVGKYFEPETQDLLFSCPPYFDIEVYSDLPNDASNQATYEDFMAILRNAFSGAIRALKPNRFAVIVVGDIRAKDGFYYGFPEGIKRIFADNGVRLYNELILVEPLGTLPQRVGRYMRNRKMGKCHQNVLVFFKGDPESISKLYPRIEYESEDLESFGLD